MEHTGLNSVFQDHVDSAAVKQKNHYRPRHICSSLQVKSVQDFECNLKAGRGHGEVEGEEMQRLHLHKDLHQQHLCVPVPLVTCQAAFFPSSVKTSTA